MQRKKMFDTEIVTARRATLLDQLMDRLKNCQVGQNKDLYSDEFSHNVILLECVSVSLLIKNVVNKTFLTLP